jgi:hypothetical protein
MSIHLGVRIGFAAGKKHHSTVFYHHKSTQHGIIQGKKRGQKQA